MFQHDQHILVVTGHYGSGKTNLSVNLALSAKAAGRQVVLADLDIVNPYFRSADFAGLLTRQGIEVVSPIFAGTNLDVPALTAELDAAILTEKTLIIDVGGDDTGAVALGRYRGLLNEAGGCGMLYVVNAYRYLTRTPDEACALLRSIESVSGLRVSEIVNNSNLAEETTAQTVADSMEYAYRCAKYSGVPLGFTSVKKDIFAPTNVLLAGAALYPVDIYVKKPWEDEGGA